MPAVSRFVVTITYFLLPMTMATIAPHAAAVEPEIRIHSGFDDFALGLGTRVHVDRQGALVLGPAQRMIGPLPTQARSLAQWRGKLVVGGRDGQLLILDHGRPRTLLHSDGSAVEALVVDGAGALYAGTSPRGLIYRLEEEDRPKLFAETGSRYVWDLEADHQGGLLAALGARAAVVSIGVNGVRRFSHRFDGENHVRSVTIAAGRIYAGTSMIAVSRRRWRLRRHQGTARVFELSPTEGPREIVVSEFQEVRHLLSVSDTLYAAVHDGDAESPRAAILRILPSGVTFTVWEGEGVWAGVEDAGDGGLLAVLRNPDRVIWISLLDERHQNLARVLDFVPGVAATTKDGLVLGEAEGVRVAAMGPMSATRGHFDSPVLGWKNRCHWGDFAWEGEVPSGTLVQLRSRSGNTTMPDTSWSPWSEPLQTSGRPANSPPGRYLQYRLELQGEGLSPRIRTVSIVARQQNLAPVIERLDTGWDSPMAFGFGSTEERQMHASWRAADPNADELSYQLYLRGEQQQRWKLLQDEISDTTWSWTTRHMAEGRTELRLVASDHPDNPRSLALETDRVGPSFVIDHSPPELSITARLTEIEVVAVDRISQVAGARYSIDYGLQEAIAATDGRFDDHEEHCRVALPELSPGDHVISVQAWDEKGNLGVTHVVVEIGRNQ
ncbi:MAG: hypothetical protein VX733_02970 [Candidatus Latescibacterota bacterium]|nr:hypothetical protein [Candidatus Latescibacterota bacterium]